MCECAYYLAPLQQAAIAELMHARVREAFVSDFSQADRTVGRRRASPLAVAVLGVAAVAAVAAGQVAIQEITDAIFGNGNGDCGVGSFGDCGVGSVRGVRMLRSGRKMRSVRHVRHEPSEPCRAPGGDADDAAGAATCYGCAAVAVAAATAATAAVYGDVDDRFGSVGRGRPCACAGHRI